MFPRCDDPKNYQDYEIAKQATLDVIKTLIPYRLTYNDFILVLETVKKEVEVYAHISVDESDTVKE